MLRAAVLLAVLALVAAACAPKPEAGTPASEGIQHAVPLEEIHFDTFDGGTIPLSRIRPEQIERLRDAIPPIDRPVYQPAAAATWLGSTDLVLGYVTAAGDAYAYPLRILNYHEIVNDELAGIPVLVSYCPLCRSGIVYDRRLDGRALSFGNTSALYESDLVMFDRETGSYWWQVAGRAIVGTLTGRALAALPSTTATWQDWAALHPATRVLSRETGHARPYDRDPFVLLPAALNDGRFPFPVSDAARDARLPAGDVVLGVQLGAEARAYPLARLGDAVVNDRVGGAPVVIMTRAKERTGAAFRAEIDGRALTFALRGGAVVDEGTSSRWDLAGRAVSGPLAGKRLEPVPSRTTFWFAYVAAFPGTTLYP